MGLVLPSEIISKTKGILSFSGKVLNLHCFLDEDNEGCINGGMRNVNKYFNDAYSLFHSGDTCLQGCLSLDT